MIVLFSADKRACVLQLQNCAAIHFFAYAHFAEFMQIAADRVLRNRHLPGQLRADHSTPLLQDLSNQGLSLLRESCIIEHINSIMFINAL